MPTRIDDDPTLYPPHAALITTDDGKRIPVAGTAEGHIEVAIHAPILPFGSVHTESLTPIFQTDPIYGINPAEVIATTGLGYDPGATTGSNTGSNTGTGNLFTCSTGTTVFSFATMQSRKRLRYRAGQGVVGRFTALFPASAAASILVAGFGSSESGFFFGYNGTSFGILHSTGNAREIRTLTVTTASTATDSYVVTLGGKEFTVTATSNSSTTLTAYQISRGTYDGWKAEQRGATVVFVADSVGAKTNDFTLEQTGAGTPAAGTFATTLAGATSADTWIAQTAWNGDPLDGTGASGVTLDPSKGNVYQINIQYLGFGPVVFKIEAGLEGNNPDFVVVHTINSNNTRTTTTASQPSFPFTMAAYSAGSTTDLSVSVGSFAGFIEGNKRLTGPRMSYSGSATSSTGAYTPLFTVRNGYNYGGRANQAILDLLSISGAAKSNTGLTTFYLIRNATLTGTPNYTAWDTTSCTYVDTASTGCTFATNSQAFWSHAVAESADFSSIFVDEVTIEPGETVTLAVRSITSSAVCVATLNIREDQ
jgi:hypothetical protein